MTLAKKNRRAQKQELLRRAERHLNTHGLWRYRPRPAQVNAGARVLVDRLIAGGAL